MSLNVFISNEAIRPESLGTPPEATPPLFATAKERVTAYALSDACQVLLDLQPRRIEVQMIAHDMFSVAHL
jgi:hypothetical protein